MQLGRVKISSYERLTLILHIRMFACRSINTRKETGLVHSPVALVSRLPVDPTEHRPDSLTYVTTTHVRILTQARRA